MKARYIMVGGFLGAGKTTALLRAAEQLTARGLRVGLITNDQSGGLVDTALARAHELPVAEIAGGCFCCRFTSLVEAAANLDRDARPDVFLAEPVGSCTDLQATVNQPLRYMYGDRYAVAPLSVLMDPVRALRVLGLESGGSFSSKVLYVYRKQLEEAELLVINKVDLVDAARIERLREALQREHPAAEILELSARTGAGLDAWLARLVAEEGAARALEIDYDEYADGEALLGWLNCTARLGPPTLSAKAEAPRYECDGLGVDGDELLLEAGRLIRAALAAGRIEVAHLKMTLTPDGGHAIGAVNIVRTESEPELAFALDASIDSGELTLNLRAETDPAQLEQIVRDALAAAGQRHGVSLAVQHLERFRPGRPVPTHRILV